MIAVVLLLFGRGKISDPTGDVAQGIEAFKKGMSDDDDRQDRHQPVDPKTIDHQARRQAPPIRSSSMPRPSSKFETST